VTIEDVLLATSQPSTLDEVVFARADLWPLLFLLPLVAGGFVWAARQRLRCLHALGNPALVERLAATAHHGNRLIRAVAFVLATACVCLALMRLQYGGTAEIVPASGLDVVIAVDYSKSMLAQDVYPSRSERLEAELGRFLDDADRRGDRVGLVIFAGGARGLPVTRDTRLLKLYLDHADPRTETPGGTAIGRALKLALAFLVDARAETQSTEEEATGQSDQAIILLTDGEDNSSRPLEIAEEAARLGVRIYTVGIGSRSGEPIARFKDGEPDGYVTDDDGKYLMTRLNEESLQRLAAETQGRYVRVEAERFGLDEVREVLESTSRSQREDTIEIHRREGFVFLLAPALALLCVSMALGERRRETR
jgi:Ca-activated chloride channel family protein